MPLIAAPFVILALAALAAIGGGFVAKNRKEEVTSDERRLWGLIAKALDSGKPDDFITAANLARVLGKPRTADQLFSQAATAGKKARLAAHTPAARAAGTPAPVKPTHPTAPTRRRS